MSNSRQSKLFAMQNALYRAQKGAECEMLDQRLAALRRRGLVLPPPMVVADSWLSDAKLRQHVGHTHQGTLLVEGKAS